MLDYGAEAARRRREQGGVAVLVGHLMIERALAGGGERELTMGITYAVSSAAVPVDLDYVALGHVHRPQTLPGVAAPGRYCGSPMALDFSEDNHAKSVVVVDVGGDTTRAREVPLAAARPLVRLRGRLDDLGGARLGAPGRVVRVRGGARRARHRPGPAGARGGAGRPARGAALRRAHGALPEAGAGGGDAGRRATSPTSTPSGTARQGRTLGAGPRRRPSRSRVARRRAEEADA